MIDERSFLEYRNLVNVTISASVKEIGDDAFYGCQKLVIHTREGCYAAECAKANDINYQVIKTK